MQMDGTMDLYVDRMGVRVRSTNGGEVDVRPYDAEEIMGLTGGLADGARVTLHDGVTVTRLDNLAIWVSPRSSYP